MTVDRRVSQLLTAQQELRAMHDELRHFGGGFGSGGSPPMEERVTRLEGRIDKVVDELGDVKVNIATLSERVSHLPSKGYINTTIIGALAAVAALVGFADQIRAFISG